MSRNVFMKAFLFLIISSIIATSFSSCGKKDEYGTVEDAEISAEEEEPEVSEDNSVFTRQDSPFSDYKYKKRNYQNAKFSFDVPKNWKETIVNASCIRYDVPADDPHFAGARFYIKCNYYYQAVPNDLDPFSDNATEFSKPMAPYLTGLPFPYGKPDVWIHNYTASDKMTEPDFCSEEHGAALKTTCGVILENKNTADVASVGSMDLVAGYFKWSEFPVMIETVVPSDWTEDAENMISYMMSTVSPVKQRLGNLVTCSYRNISFELPSDFQARAGRGNIFYAPVDDIKATSGIAVGIFNTAEFGNGQNGTITPTLEYIQENYSDSVADALMHPDIKQHYYLTTSCVDYEGDPLYDEIADFSANVNLITDLADYKGAENFYGLGGMMYMDMYIVEKSGHSYMIAAMFMPQQVDIATKLMKNVMMTLAVS